MKDKQLLLLIALIVFNVNIVLGQEFAPIGAKWHYTERFPNPEEIGYVTITSEKDTIIKNKACRLLDCDYVCWELSGNQYIYSQNDSVYFYDQKIDTFQLLYAFDAQKGDSWEIRLQDYNLDIYTLKVNIDSTYETTINDINLRTYDVTYTILNFRDNEDYSYSSTVIEKFGDLKYMFNIPDVVSAACDANRPDGMRCYEDSDFGFYSTGIADSCTYTYDYFVGIGQNNQNNTFKIFPNPSMEWIDIESNLQNDYLLKIYTIRGQEIHSEKVCKNTRIDISNLSKGVYVIQLFQNNKVLKIQKIIKQ